MKYNRDSSDRTSDNETQVQAENCEIWNSGIMPKKEHKGVFQGFVPKCRGKSVSASIEDFALEDWSVDVVEPGALKGKKEMDQADFVSLKMNMLSGKADLIQVMVGLTRLGCAKPTLAQARMLFESLGCKITDCMTTDHIRQFLQSPQQGEDSWLSNVRQLMVSVLCDPDLVK